MSQSIRSLSRRRKLDQELAGAARMQRQLLPPIMPDHPAVKFGAYCHTSLHAGGDNGRWSLRASHCLVAVSR